MTIDEIKELIQVVSDTGIAELTVQRGEHSVKIVRALVPSQERVVPVPTVMPVSVAAPMQSLPLTPHLHLEPASPAEASHAPAPPATEPDYLVKSPIVGTYYDAPAPDAPKFVKVGDHVEPKQVLCIIESMKLMNEIEAEVAGTIVSKYIDNGRPVEYGEALFSIHPSKP